MTDLAAPRDSGFSAPWQAQIFALVVTLEARGLFPWSAFQAALTAAIAAAPAEQQTPEFYYRHWLNAAEHLLRDLGQCDAADLTSRIQALRAVAPAHTHDHHHP